MSTKIGSEVVFSLRRSRVRQLVLEYLVSIYPEESYASEISREIRIRLNEVCGALNGSPRRYEKENSLINLGLVKKEKRKNFYQYTATEKGCRVWNLFKQI